MALDEHSWAQLDRAQRAASSALSVGAVGAGRGGVSL
jgi:hypothetical protein